MKRLLERLEESNNMKRYVVTISGGKVTSSVGNEVLGYDDADYRALSVAASKLARSDFDDDDDLLAGYIHGTDKIKKDRVSRIDTPNIRIGNDGKVETTFQVEAAADLTAAEKNALVDHVMGQCSDGWGEGFEQQAIKLDGSDEEYYVSTWSRRATGKIK